MSSSRATARAACGGVVLLLVLPSLLLSQGWGGESFREGKIHIGGGGDAALRSMMIPAGEGPYHTGQYLVCSDCHVMHASLQHDYQGGGVPWQTTPTDYLLKAPDPLDLCLMCHDGTAGTPDVVGADVNGLVRRAGGFFDQPEVVSPHGHDLGRGILTGGNYCMRCHSGNPNHAKVTCIDCHAHHGNGNPRNLQWISDPGLEPPFGLFIDPSAADLDRYERARVSYGTLNDVTLREVTNMCIDCHHVFSGGQYIDPDADGIHSRHPAYDSERNSPNNISQGAIKGSTNPAHWEQGTGSGFIGTERVKFVVDGAFNYADALVVDATTNGVFCLSCHDAHGSDEPFALTWPIENSIDEVGCDQCHYVAQVD